MASGNGVSNCYVFKSRLQEYAQKAGIPTPVYETMKEGPSHEPSFKSTVIVNNVRYESLPGFFNRKAAEQSAAEIAFKEILKSGNISEYISHPVHETGLCKNMLQEYAQKMNYAIPSYTTVRLESAAKMPFSCTVEIGGIQYIGAAARTKKEAEIKAARTALLAIDSNASGTGSIQGGSSVYTVLPSKKKGKDSETCSEEAKPLKPKKADFKKRWSKRRFRQNKGDRSKISQSQPDSANGEDMVNSPDRSFPDSQIEDSQSILNAEAMMKVECSHEGENMEKNGDIPFEDTESALSKTEEISGIVADGRSASSKDEILRMEVISHMHFDNVSSKALEAGKADTSKFEQHGEGLSGDINITQDGESHFSLACTSLVLPGPVEGIENDSLVSQIAANRPKAENERMENGYTINQGKRCETQAFYGHCETIELGNIEQAEQMQALTGSAEPVSGELLSLFDKSGSLF